VLALVNPIFLPLEYSQSCVLTAEQQIDSLTLQIY
jgi:hypothetical protein